jgi:hypothetical protein
MSGLSEQLISEIADKEGIINTKLFVAFMNKRFSGERSPQYVAEWARRFVSGNPVTYMDSESKKAYEECVRDY